MANQVVNTAICKCAFGSAPAVLAVPPSAKVLCCSLPAATIMDNKLPPFGTCSNPANPAVAAAAGAPVPCTPVCLAPWAPGSPTVFIAGKIALNKSAVLMCTYPGGVITVQSPMATTVTVP